MASSECERAAVDEVFTLLGSMTKKKAVVRMTGSSPLLISVLDVIQHVKECSACGVKKLWARLKVAHPEVRYIFRWTKCTPKDKRQFVLTVPSVAGERQSGLRIVSLISTNPPYRNRAVPDWPHSYKFSLSVRGDMRLHATIRLNLFFSTSHV